MVRKFKVLAFAGALVIVAGPSFADSLVIPPEELITTVATDVGKGVAEFNPIEILTPKPIDTAPAAEPPKKLKKRYAKRRVKRMAKK